MRLVISLATVLLGLVSLPQPTHCLTIDIHQAEDAVSLGGVSTETGPNTGYTGSGYADFNGGQGAFLLWNVNAAFEGDYSIAIRYASPNARPMDLYVDNVKQSQGYAIAPTGNWNEWQQEAVNVRLSSGAHQIKVAQLTNEGPNIDWMSIEGPLDGRSTVLESDQVLNAGEFRSSPRGLFKAGLDDSGQLVIQEGSSSTVIWSSGKSGGSTCYMQRDGNLVVRDGK
jgi:Carbohydrate binding module (family 6)